MIKDGTLTACMPFNGGVMSGRRIDGGAGLDYGIASALADYLKLSLKVIWFEGELDEESNPLNDTFAMLSSPLCDVVPGHALYAPTLGAPMRDRAALPRWKKRKNSDTPVEPTYVTLLPITATNPYARVEMGFVFNQQHSIQSFDDIEGLRLGVQEGTLAGAISLSNASDSARSTMVSRNPGPKFLWDMEQGDFDVALISTAEYDFHKQQNPITKLVLSDYRHAIGFNIGMAILRNNEALKVRVDEGINHILDQGIAEQIIKEKNFHMVAPKEPMIMPKIRSQDLF